MGKDQMGSYGDWIQFQSNNVAEVPLFMEKDEKRALSNVKAANETIKGSYPDATDTATFGLYVFHYKRVATQS